MYFALLQIHLFYYSIPKYSLYVCSLSINLSAFMSIILFATVCINWWSCDVKIIFPGNLLIPSFNAVILSISKWFVGSSNIKKFAPESIILDNTHLTFSPPDSTFTPFNASSPENNILPKKLLTYVSSGSLEYCLNQSVIDKSLWNK